MLFSRIPLIGMICVKLPIPNIEEQKAIVKIYSILEDRKEINKLKQSIKPLVLF